MSRDQQRLFPRPPPPPPPEHHPAAADKRLCHIMLETTQFVLDPTANPPQIQSWFCVPAAAALWMSALSPAAARLYLHLWQLTGRFASGLPNRWFYHTDDLLAPATRLTPRSLARARRDLRQAGIAFISLATPHKQPTWYALRWPPPQPPNADRAALILVAREMQASGEPWPALSAWRALGQQERASKPPHPDARHISEQVAAAIHPRLRPHLLRTAIADLQETDPWLAKQLAWGAPAHCPAPSHQTASSSFAPT